MSLSRTVENALEKAQVAYRLHAHQKGLGLDQVISSLSLPEASVLRAVLLKDISGRVILVVLPFNRLIDFHAIKQEMGGDFSPLLIEQASLFFPDCVSTTIPALAKPYRLEMLIDESVKRLDRVFLEGGMGLAFIELLAEDFLKINSGMVITGISKSDEIVRLSPANSFVESGPLTPAMDAKKRLETLYKLPPMPEIAMRLIKLRNDPYSNSQKLAEIVELDPSLSAQVIRYANSSFFGFRGELDSIHGAISRVLGFDVVMNMALGLSAGGTLRNPPDGPLGLRTFWRQATYTAVLAQQLSQHIPCKYEVKPGMAYLVGLLHDFGFMLLGHLFQPEFFLLNKMVAANPEVSVTVLEKHALGMGQTQYATGVTHTELGGWLMAAWGMPEEVIVTVKEHHNSGYQGEFQAYPALIAVANHLLERYEIGNKCSDDELPLLCERVGLGEQEAFEIMERLLEDREGLDVIAERFAA